MAKTLDNYIQEITTLAAGRNMSTRWYRDQVRTVAPRTFSESAVSRLIKSGNTQSRPTYGTLNLYMYDPKLKEVLEYYDIFPLVMPIKKHRDGFTGINFHYLSVPMRLKLVEFMRPLAGENRIIGWNRISRYKLIRPCVKRYLAPHVQSRFLKINEEDFTIACMMPVQRFRKASAGKVWSDSRRIAV